jgi:hypothetical protein
VERAKKSASEAVGLETAAVNVADGSEARETTGKAEQVHAHKRAVAEVPEVDSAQQLCALQLAVASMRVCPSLCRALFVSSTKAPLHCIFPAEGVWNAASALCVRAPTVVQVRIGDHRDSELAIDLVVAAARIHLARVHFRGSET